MSTVIRVENVSKLYRLGEVGTGSLAHDVNRWWHKMRGKEDPYLKIGQVNDRTKAQKSEVRSQKSEVRSQKSEVRSQESDPSDTSSLTSDLRPPTSDSTSSLTSDLRPLSPDLPSSDYVYALKDINFEVKQGEVLGIIGRNGAGKSTLLKILSRVTTPTTGQIKVKGRIASLLEVGTGFHPELTGRENIFLNGAILGMRKHEISAKFDEIVDFSGCERYIDTPVKRYSSGMYVRLAFAVAAHLEPEILIVDEVLAVGDAEFQKKCLGKMKDVAGQGRTVLFVSHNMAAVRQLCDKLLLLKSGFIEALGTVPSVLQDYLNQGGEVFTKWNRGEAKFPTECGFLTIDLELYGEQPEHILTILCVMRLNFSKKVMIAFDITDSSGTTIMQVLPMPEPFIDGQGIKKIDIKVALPPIIPGSYEVSAWVGTHNSETLESIERCVKFEITRTPTIGRTVPHTSDHGWVAPRIISIDID